MEWDIVIIGAGPAGATLARLLNQQQRVLLVDRRNLSQTGGFKKPVCCGGLIAPDAQKILACQGLGIPKDVLVSPQLFSVQTLDFDNDLLRFYQRHYINVDRERFDHWLLSLVKPSVTLWDDAQFIRSEHNHAGHCLQIRRHGQTHKVRTKILVGADGAMSRVRLQNFGDKPMPQRYVSVQQWFDANRIPPHYYAIFDRQISDFYSWLIPKDNALILGTAMRITDDVNAHFKRLQDKLRALGIIDGLPQKSEGTLIMRPRSFSHIQLSKPHTALVGEAAGLISPSSAEGISYALKSGELLALAISQHKEQFVNAYRQSCLSLKHNIFNKNIKLHAMYRPALRKLIMRSGITSLKSPYAQTTWPLGHSLGHSMGSE